MKENNIEELIYKIIPIIPNLTQSYIELEKIKIENLKIINPQIISKYILHLIIMISIIGSIFYLAIYKIIDGSATVGLLGTMVGYVFGYLYSKKE